MLPFARSLTMAALCIDDGFAVVVEVHRCGNVLNSRAKDVSPCQDIQKKWKPATSNKQRASNGTSRRKLFDFPCALEIFFTKCGCTCKLG